MSLQEQLVTLLSGATDAGTRISPLTAPDNTLRPYITYQRISANSENVMSGSSGLINTRLQLDIYADSYVQAQTISGQVDALMAGWALQNVAVLQQDLYEESVKLFRISQDYSVWHS